MRDVGVVWCVDTVGQFVNEWSRCVTRFSLDSPFASRNGTIEPDDWSSLNKKSGSNMNQRLLERLEAENALLRGRVVELAIQIQALRDALDHPQSEIPLNRYHRRLGYKR